MIIIIKFIYDYIAFYNTNKDLIRYYNKNEKNKLMIFRTYWGVICINDIFTKIKGWFFPKTFENNM